jgi:CheY-like chemotaxis protein
MTENLNTSLELEQGAQGGAHDKNRTPEAHPAPESLKVWLVDDNDDFRELFGSLLSREGIECQRDFPSADAALSALASKRGPDVLLLDVHMKGQNGLDAIRPIKSLARSTKVVMLTTFYDSERHSRAIRDGASDFLLKSYDFEELIGRIRKPQTTLPMPGSCPSRAEKRAHGQPAVQAGTSTPGEGRRRRTPADKPCGNWLTRRLQFLNGLLK